MNGNWRVIINTPAWYLSESCFEDWVPTLPTHGQSLGVNAPNEDITTLPGRFCGQDVSGTIHGVTVEESDSVLDRHKRGQILQYQSIIIDICITRVLIEMENRCK